MCQQHLLFPWIPCHTVSFIFLENSSDLWNPSVGSSSHGRPSMCPLSDCSLPSDTRLTSHARDISRSPLCSKVVFSHADTLLLIVMSVRSFPSFGIGAGIRMGWSFWLSSSSHPCSRLEWKPCLRLQSQICASSDVPKNVLLVKSYLLTDHTRDLRDLLNSSMGPNLERGEFRGMPVGIPYKSTKTKECVKFLDHQSMTGWCVTATDDENH